MIGRHPTLTYEIPIAGRTLRVLGPRDPHKLHADPEMLRRNDADGYKPWWAQPWPAAVMLAEHVLRHTTPGLDPVLDLGAGLGITSLTLAQRGDRVIATDYDEDALDFIRASAALNNITLADVRRLDWRSPPADRYPIILAADVLYEKRALASLLALLQTCLAPGGQAFFSDPLRSAADAFPAALQAAGFHCTSTAVRAPAIQRPDARDGRTFDGRVFQITHRSA